MIPTLLGLFLTSEFFRIKSSSPRSFYCVPQPGMFHACCLDCEVLQVLILLSIRLLRIFFLDLFQVVRNRARNSIKGGFNGDTLSARHALMRYSDVVMHITSETVQILLVNVTPAPSIFLPLETCFLQHCLC